jgi:glycosyltransferase involved in cell wall biosynthesis
VKIALIAPTEIPARRANTIQVMKMAQALAAEGHDVRMAIPRAAGASSAGLSPAELAQHYGLRLDFPRHWLPAAPALRRYDYSLRALSWAKSWDAGLIYTRLPQAAALSSLRGLPTLFELHDLPAPGSNTRLLNLALRGRGLRRVVAITRALAADLQRSFPRLDDARLVVAPDGVDLERYANLPQPAEARRRLAAEFGLHLPDTFTAGYTGHLYPGRGAELLPELARRLPQVHFLVVGGEPGDVERLRLQAQQAGLTNLTLTGFVPNAVLPLYQAACDALLMPYGQRVAASSGGDIARYLSPMKLFEYLACGRPILSSSLQVLTETLTPANACLLPGLDAEAWAAVLERLMSDEDERRRLSAAALLDARRYTWEARARHMLGGLPDLIP